MISARTRIKKSYIGHLIDEQLLISPKHLKLLDTVGKG